MTLPLSRSVVDDAVVVTVGGSIDVHTAPLLRAELAAIAADGTRRAVVDLDGVDFLDSSALGALVGAHKDFAERHATLRVVCAQPRLLRIFEITRLDEVLAIAASVSDAVAGR